MPPIPWGVATGTVLFAALCLSLAIRASSVQARPSQRRNAWIKGLAALRTIASAALGLLVFAAVLAAVAGAAAAVRWTATIAAGCGLVAILLNAVAGLWLLSPWVGADLGLEVTAAGTRGVIRGYGWARLQLTTHAGWTAHLPYLSIALGPFVVCRQDGPRLLELTIRRDHFSDDELRYLHQAAVLSPYRDPSLPVSVTRRPRAAGVRLGLAQRATRERIQRHLERALAQFREKALARRSDRH